MENEEQMPKDHGLDHSLKSVNEGYEFIINRRPSFNRNVFAVYSKPAWWYKKRLVLAAAKVRTPVPDECRISSPAVAALSSAARPPVAWQKELL